MKNQIIKKALGITSLVIIIAVFSINTKILNTSASDLSLANLVSLNTANAEWPWEWPWDKDWGLQEELQACRLDLGGGVFTSSVKTGCITIECVVPLDCECMESACGDSF